jgi:hypothetical protein
MINEKQLLTTLALPGESRPSIPFDSVHHSAELQNLHRAFREPEPLAVLTGNSSTETKQLIDSFLDSIGSDVTVLRIASTCSDALEGMREVVRVTGFQSQNMTLMELEIMFMKFLSLQRFHNLRTVFLIEATPENDGWVRDKVRDLVKLEAAGIFGLMVILTRQAASDKPADELTLDTDSSAATIDPPKKMRKLFPSAAQKLPANGQNGSDLNGSSPVELKLKTDGDDTVPLNINLTHQGERLHELTLEQPRMMIGRAEDNDLCINSTKVSRHHAILVQHGAGAILMDLNSTNGTFVNSHRINDQAVVHNDIIVIGNHHIRFIAPSAPHTNGAD